MTRSMPARLGLIGGLVAASIFSIGQASAQEGMAFKNLMGNIGIIPKEKDPIAYRERAPLVVPPKTELRAPGSAAYSSNPAWPNDPDVAARRRAAEEARGPVTWSETRRMSSDNNLRLTPQEIQAGRVARHAPTDQAAHRGDSARDVLYLSPDQLRAKRSEDVALGPEPTRRSLTDPPSGMRKSNGKAGTGGDFKPRVDQQALDANPMTWLTRRFKSDDDE